MSSEKKMTLAVIILELLVVLIVFIFVQCYRQRKNEPEPVSPVLVTNPPTNPAPQKKLVEVVGAVTNGIIELRGDQTKLIFSKCDK